MNKADLISAVAESADISKASATRAIDAMVEAITNSLANDDSVSLIGFGTFVVRKRDARKGFNPKTKEPMDIPASNVPAFKAGKALKEAVN